ncbi:hypothetical protein DOTSEDRAFT_30446 [Dothistroma septosporum NZE10]|uniref:UEV domain-containing protein n=1 Tax=Dothistroma septosporum (strain NZE10 / CBS 128990) TaxID=675120 RepID=N1Q0F5_DOTSN|nr:hypothetical protein DOTSEDRAFT_30446 [Dothistroma septosporum NZE10]
MTQVSDKVLAWLYSVLHEYHDPQRTYSDAARTLSAYPSLQTRTEAYTYENGSSALLVILHGTLPVDFRGTTYRFPVKLWIPHAYPHEAPILYVDPAKDMTVRPGQHVGVDGRVYHPYLRDWARMWDRANIAEFMEFLQQVFAREPPVIRRAQQQQYQRPATHGQQQMAGASQTPPRLPPRPGASSSRSITTSADNAPPPVPPKPGEEYAEDSRNTPRGGPPLPPLPPLPRELPAGQQRTLSSQASNGQWRTQSAHGSFAPAVSSHQNSRPPGPSPLPQHLLQQQAYPPRSNHDSSPVSPVSPVHGYSELPEAKYSRPPPFLQAQFQQRTPRPRHLQKQHHQQGFQVLQPQPFQPVYSQNQAAPRQAALKQPAPDLLTDPFDVALPSSSGSSLPAPPIPPNPEREHLLHAITETLVQQAQQKVGQNLAAIAPLQAQHSALRSAHDRLEGEIGQIAQLEQVLASNETILHRSIQECDRTIKTTKSKTQPPIDDVLIAPTMVANQLWTLCAEEAASREAMYVLQKAVDRGRVSGNDFVRQMRGLGRECFLKMALARKCARGMGLELR